MHVQGFSPGAVTSTVALGGLATVPATYVIGFLSDKFSRRHVLILVLGLAAVGALILSVAGELWSFWLATALLFAARGANGVVAPAMAADLSDTDARERGLPFLNTANYLAGILGFAAAGCLIESADLLTLHVIAAALAIASTAFMLVPLSGQNRVASRKNILSKLQVTRPRLSSRSPMLSYTDLLLQTVRRSQSGLTSTLPRQAVMADCY